MFHKPQYSSRWHWYHETFRRSEALARFKKTLSRLINVFEEKNNELCILAPRDKIVTNEALTQLADADGILIVEFLLN